VSGTEKWSKQQELSRIAKNSVRCEKNCDLEYIKNVLFRLILSGKKRKKNNFTCVFFDERFIDITTTQRTGKNKALSNILVRPLSHQGSISPTIYDQLFTPISPPKNANPNCST